jgi:Ca-activated chloride channel homolog
MSDAVISEFVTVALTVRFLAGAMLALAFLSIALTLLRRRRQPAELIPSVSIQKNLPRLSAVRMLPQAFFLMALLATNCWLAQPVIPVLNETRSLERRDIFIAVDKSGSMDSIIEDAQGNSLGRKIEAAAQALKFFVARRQGDRVGLAVFDDNTYLHWPLTDDLNVILKKADLIPAYAGGGTNFETVTGPIQVAIDHWQEYGQASTKVLIMISDGEAPISEERMTELARQMKEQGGKIYFLGVGDTWTDPAKAESSQVQAIKKLIAELNGKIFAVADPKQMIDAVSEIDTLEKSVVKVEVTTTFRDVSRYFGLAACLFLFLFIAGVALTRERA